MIEEERSLISFPRQSNILMHDDCRTELIKLIQENERPDFIASYKTRIDFLSKNIGNETVLHRKWFEVLKKAKGLRSIRFMKFRNLRILYTVEQDKAFLLLAFEEAQGHENTEYKHFIGPALKRYSEKEKLL